MNQEENSRPQEADDAASADSISSYYRASAFSQFGYLFVLMLKLKTWWFLLLPLPATLLLANMYLPLLLKPSSPSGTGNLRRYTATEFTAEKNHILVDRTSFPMEVSALEKITKDRGGTTGRLLECTPESKCRAQLISEREQADAYIRFSKSPGVVRAISECFWVKDSSLRCAYIYQLMVQAMSSATGMRNSEFNDVQFFTLKDSKNISSSDDEITGQVMLKKSICAEWISKGLHVFDQNLDIYLEASLSLSTIGVAIYFMLATAFRMRALKTNGFLKQLVRSGLSVTSYWTVVWLITLVECLAFSGLFVMSYVLHCPGVYPAKNILYVFLALNLHFLILSGMVFALELLVPSSVAAILLMLLIAFGQIISFSYYSAMKKTGSFIPFLFPPVQTKSYIVTHMTADIRHKLTGIDPVSSQSSLHLSVILSISTTALFFILLVTYLDCLLRTGNGLNLPWYYPLTCRFWLPEKAKDDDRVHLASKVVEDPAVEPMTGFSASIIADRISKSYNACCCCLSGPEVLHRVSCLVFRDQVTALVGHSFAGKSTILKILTGDEEPSSGTAYVAGFRMTDPLERLAARGIYSVCPQIDSLCASLTAMECIEAVLVSKGANFPSELDRARVMLEQLEVRGIETARTKELSISQKRKLSTVLALLADPDVVFLDEPTNGLDPISALQLWGLLQEEKHGRSIVVCTQSMHEADLLADRKVIMCDGDLVCAGTSPFLQQIFGCSTTLSVKLKREKDSGELIQKLPQTSLKRKNGTEVQLEVKKSGSFSALDNAVKILEDSNDIVASFSVSQATISDVFKKLDGMKISDFSEHLRSGKLLEYLENVYSEMSNSRPDMTQSQAKAPVIRPSVFSRLWALFVINLKRQFRSGWQIASRIILPLLFLIGLGAWTPVQMILYKSTEKINSDQIMNETDSYSGIFGVQSQSYSRLMDANIVCMLDREIVESHDTAFCTSLLFSKMDFIKPRIIRKPKSETMKAFLQQPSTIRQLREGCKGIEVVMPPCIVYYATSWNLSLPNKQRLVTIGVFLDSESTTDTAHLLRRGFSQLSRLFQAGELQNTTALSHIRPFSQYSYFCLEILLLLAVFSIFPISFLRDVVEDITSNMRFQFLAMGMGHWSYWVYTFFVHWFQYAICFAISASVLVIWERYRALFYLLKICLPVLLFGTVSNQLAVYIIASVSKSSTAVTTVCYQIFTLLLPYVLILMRLQGMVLVAPLIFLLPSLAPFSVAYFGTLHAIYKLEYYHLENIADIPNVFLDLWKNNILYVLSFAAILVHFLIFCWMLVLVEKWDIVQGKCSRSGNYNELEIEKPKNPNVVNEQKRLVKSSKSPQNVLEIFNLRKSWPNGVEAVRGVTFGAMWGEILGLLGSGGAGKSTLLSVLVGKERPTEGSCSVRSRNASWQLDLRSIPVGAIGYCPQHCPLYDSITISEHLVLYARIRGVPRALARSQSISLIGSLGLLNRQHHQACQLSIGERRRLCLATALLGDPALVVLDEATAGVDPKSRGLIRSAIVSLRHQSRAVLLATRRFEQADALCDRVGVMNRGRMIAFNTVLNLNSLFDEAYTLELIMEKVSPGKLQQNKRDLKGSLAVIFEGTSVLNDWGLCVQICVPKWATGGVVNILGWLANNTKLLGVQRYMMRQMSPDESLVFLAGRFDPRRPPMRQQVSLRS